jgi:hypothetical protein
MVPVVLCTWSEPVAVIHDWTGCTTPSGRPGHGPLIVTREARVSMRPGVTELLSVRWGVDTALGATPHWSGGR